MGNQREIRQVSPRQGLGVVVPIHTGHAADVARLVGGENELRFYTYFCPAGVPIDVCNMDGLGPDIQLPAQGS